MLSNELKGMIAGFVATLVLTAMLLINNGTGMMPEIDLIRLLMRLGTLTPAAAWMDHFIVGVVVWGLLFAMYDGLTTSRAYWLKGILFGLFAWLVMMVTFLPLAGAGLFGSKIGAAAVIGLLILHLIYGVVLGGVYGVLGEWLPKKVHTAEEKAVVEAEALASFNRDTSVSFNDDLPSSSPSGRTMLFIFGGFLAFVALMVLANIFRTTLGL
jgi:hypothetical protein